MPWRPPEDKALSSDSGLNGVSSLPSDDRPLSKDVSLFGDALLVNNDCRAPSEEGASPEDC